MQAPVYGDLMVSGADIKPLWIYHRYLWDSHFAEYFGASFP